MSKTQSPISVIYDFDISGKEDDSKGDDINKEGADIPVTHLLSVVSHIQLCPFGTPRVFRVLVKLGASSQGQRGGLGRFEEQPAFPLLTFLTP